MNMDLASDVTSFAPKHRDLPRVLRRAVGLVRFARISVGASSASLFLADVDHGVLRGLVSEWDWTRTSFPVRLADWPSVREALADGELRVVSAADAREAERGWFEPRGIATSVCVPMRGRTGALGVLFFDFATRTTPLARLERAFLGDVGRRCARALERAADVKPEVDTRWMH